MSRPEFIECATRTLATAQDGDTIIVAVLRPNDSMVMHTAGIDPFMLTDAARSLLEQAEDELRRRQTVDNDQGDHPDEQLLSSIMDALACLPPADED